MVDETLSDALVHCWEKGPDASDGCGTSCVLPDGHAGPHEWTRDDQIVVRFSDGDRR